MKAIRCFCLALAAAVAAASTAAAAEDKAAAPPPAAPGPSLRITPKVQYYIQSTNLRSDSTSTQSSSDQFQMPFYGATLDYRPAAWRDTEFAFTVMHGDGDFNTTGVSTNGSVGLYRADVSRTDVELFVRNYVPKTDFNWTYGVRWVHAPLTITNRSGASFADSNSPRHELDHDYYAFLVGANIDTPVSPSGAHRIIGGVNLGVGYQHDHCANCDGDSTLNQSAVVLMPEMNFGYRYVINSANSAYVRYKFQGTCGEAGTEGGMFDEMEWGHGPEIGFTFSF